MNFYYEDQLSITWYFLGICKVHNTIVPDINTSQNKLYSDTDRCDFGELRRPVNPGNPCRSRFPGSGLTERERACVPRLNLSTHSRSSLFAFLPCLEKGSLFSCLLWCVWTSVCHSRKSLRTRTA